jgi:hypothetical protein
MPEKLARPVRFALSSGTHPEKRNHGRTTMKPVASVSVLLPFILIPGISAAQDARSVFDSAYVAWDEGRYPEALEQLKRALGMPDGDALVGPAALLTGEWYRSVEMSADAASPRWSRDGSVIAFETGQGDQRVTRVAAVGNATGRVLAQVSGSGLVLSADGSRAAYLAAPDMPELRAANAEAERLLAAGDRPGAASARAEAMRIERENARIMVVDLSNGREEQIDAPPITRGALAFGDDGELYVVGGTPGQQAALPQGGGRGGGQPLGDLVYRVSGGGAPASMMPMGSIGAFTSADAVAGRRMLLGMGRGGFAVLDLATGAAHRFDGSSPAVSRDGSAVVYLTEEGDETLINVAATDGRASPRVVHGVSVPASAPALSPDGRRVAWQMMEREDWELYTINADGSGEFQITREIQHDLSPHFLSNDRLLGLIGEGRHRRSYLYDLSVAAQPDGTAAAMANAPLPGTPGRTRLHHNNMVRTVAPEYDWVPSPDGSKVAIIADRDGDTISPERGLYVMDLNATVSKAEVIARIDTALAAEHRLRQIGELAFGPIRTEVADAVGRVSTSRIYRYANDVFQFDSKFITQPGNAKAIEYYETQLRALGYEPELQWFEARGVRSANIIARLPGTVDPDLVYVVSSHFDSVERGPGADDDSSGATALLEAARALAGQPQPRTIEFAFFTGEEAGLLGSREYVRRAVEGGKRIIGALNNDMVGYRNDNRLDNTIRYSNAGIRDLQHAAAFLFTDLITYDAKYYRSTDAAAYYEAYGDIVGGIGSYPILGNPHYHQTHDVLETIDQQLVAEVSKTTVATLMVLASSPSRINGLTVTRSGSSVSAQWTPAVESDVSDYIVAWGPASDPERNTVPTTTPAATLENVRAGDVVMVRAVNRAGMQSWDWARAEIR